MAISGLNAAHGYSTTLILGPEIFGFEREATGFEGAHRSGNSSLGFLGEVRAAGVTGGGVAALVSLPALPFRTREEPSSPCF